MSMKFVLPLAAALLLGTGVAHAEPMKGHGKFMAAIDTDKDGVISAEESAAHAAQKFDEIDTDKDGVVSLDELEKHRAAEKAQHEERRAKRAEEMKKKHLEKIDPDGDGKITKDEFLKNAAERHERMEKRAKGKDAPKGDKAE